MTQATIKTVASQENVNMLTVLINGNPVQMSFQEVMALTPATRQAMQITLDEQAEQRLKSYQEQQLREHAATKTGKGKNTKKEEAPTVLLELASDAVVTLDMLVPFENSGIKNAKIAVRPLNRSNVHNLREAYRNGANIPKLRLTNSSKGILIDAGHHRYAALLELLEEKCEHVDGKLTEAGKAQLEEAKKLFKVDFEPLNGLTPMQLRSFVFTDNLTHGEGVSETGRSRYAIAIIDEAVSEGRKINREKVYKELNVSRQAVATQRARIEAERLEELGTIIAAPDFSTLDELDKAAAIDEYNKLQAKKSKKNNDKEEAIDPLAQIVDTMLANFEALYNHCTPQNVSVDELRKYVADSIATKAQYESLQYYCNAFCEIELSADKQSELK